MENGSSDYTEENKKDIQSDRHEVTIIFYQNLLTQKKKEV